jgi:hypothetical protein
MGLGPEVMCSMRLLLFISPEYSPAKKVLQVAFDDLSRGSIIYPVA